MKNKLFVIAIAALVLATLAAGSLAFFTDEATAHNVITTGDVDIELLEWADEDRAEPFPEDDVSGVMPGTAVTKLVEVKNVGSGAAWVRVSVSKSIIKADNNSGDASLMTLDIDTANWTLKDGYYYYNKPLQPGATTTPLFTKVSFSTGMGNEYQNAGATVKVTAQAVQTANNGTTALTAAGWPEIVS